MTALVIALVFFAILSPSIMLILRYLINTSKAINKKDDKSILESEESKASYEDSLVNLIISAIAYKNPAPEGTMWLMTTHLPRIKKMKYTEEQMVELIAAHKKRLEPEIKKADEATKNYVALRQRLIENGMEPVSAAATAKAATGYKDYAAADINKIVENFVEQDVDDVFATLSLVDNNMNPLDSFVHRVSRFEATLNGVTRTWTYQEAYAGSQWTVSRLEQTRAKVAEKFIEASIHMSRTYLSTSSDNAPELINKVFK